jgi:hypothetical protein
MGFIAARIIAGWLLAVPFAGALAQDHGDDVTFDYKSTQTGTAAGRSVGGQTVGHATISKGRIRIDTKGSGGVTTIVPGMQPEEVSLLVLDSGKTLIYLMPQTKQFMRVNPTELMEKASKLMESMGGTMKYEFNDDPQLEQLGAGPDILGHKTQHFRISSGMKMSVSMMGESQSMQVKSVTDYYIAPDLKVGDPFRVMQTSGLSGSFFGQNKVFMDKFTTLYAKLPNGPPLRTETQTSMTGGPVVNDARNVQEITAIHTITAAEDLFKVPADYKQVEFPLPNLPAGPPE